MDREHAGVDSVIRMMAESVPVLVRELVATRPGHVHHDALALLERPLLEHVLALTGGNQLRAARILGLNRNTLRKRCRQLAVSSGRASRKPTGVSPATAQV